jgi:hypothetical protein
LGVPDSAIAGAADRPFSGRLEGCRSVKGDQPFQVTPLPNDNNRKTSKNPVEILPGRHKMCYDNGKLKSGKMNMPRNKQEISKNPDDVLQHTQRVSPSEKEL